MTVSIIVPVYNAEAFLPDCLDSILAQTFSDFELILVDDGSSDRSPKICDDYAARDSHVRVLHTPNRGVSAARNRGVDEARGQYIMFVDADDMVHPRIVATLLAMITTYKAEAAICAFDMVSFDRLTSRGKTGLIDVPSLIRDTLYQHSFDTSLCAKLFSADAVRRAPQPSGKRYEDLATICRIYENISSPVVYSSAPMYFYRPNPKSFINNFTPDRLDVLDVTDEIEQRYRDNPDIAAAARNRRLSAHFNMYVLASRAGMADVASRCWSVIKSCRREALLDPRVRLKNKVGAFVSFFGASAVMLASKVVY